MPWTGAGACAEIAWVSNDGITGSTDLIRVYQSHASTTTIWCNIETCRDEEDKERKKWIARQTKPINLHPWNPLWKSDQRQKQSQLMLISYFFKWSLTIHLMRMITRSFGVQSRTGLFWFGAVVLQPTHRLNKEMKMRWTITLFNISLVERWSEHWLVIIKFR